MIEMRLLPTVENQPLSSAKDLGRHGPLSVEFVFRPARVTLPQRSVLGTLEVVDPQATDQPTITKIGAPDGQTYELAVDSDYPALDGLSKFLEYGVTCQPAILPELAPFPDEQMLPCTKLSATNLKINLNRLQFGDYRVQFIPQADTSSGDYKKNASGVEVDLIDLPRENTPSKTGLAQLGAWAIQAVLHVFRSRGGEPAT